MPAVLDHNGEPITRQRPRAELADVALRQDIHAQYDAAQDTDEFKNYWAAADSLDANSANSKGVRAKLVPRSRYEVGNNGYADSMVQTHCNYLVGVGPKLRMQTQSSGFNALVETRWKQWTKAIQFRRKLWCQCHAKIQDGEGFGVARNNPKVRNPVQLDFSLFETEQCQSSYIANLAVGWIDGMEFDEYSNVEFYHVLPKHPGGQWSGMNAEPERIPARFVMHWYMLRRPGQHRAVPEFRSTLNTGAQSRRWREAVIAAAENIADFSLFIKTAFQPDEMDSVAPMSTIDIQKRMMTALPNGYDAYQPRAEQPTAGHKEFLRLQITEQARPKLQPANVATGDSSDHNFASGKLDHLTWFAGIRVEREDCSDLVLDPLFELWFQEAAAVYGWNASTTPSHSWDWPPLPVADEKARATANQMRLSNGSTTLSEVYSEEGRDFEEQLVTMAADYGVAVDEMRAILLATNLGGAVRQTAGEESKEDETEDE